MTQLSQNGQWALQYARFGWPVFPLHGIVNGRCTCSNPDCKSQGKHPLTPNGFKDATTNPETIGHWWTQCPWANIGMPTGDPSGTFVLDKDPRHGGDKSLPPLAQQHGWTNTVMSFTGGGGNHYLFRKPTGIHIPCSAGKVGPGLDIRADGGYIVLPPSLHISGRHYTWAPEFSPHEIALAPALDWLVRFALADKAKTPAPPVPIREDGKLIQEGRRNNDLTSFAGRLRHAGCTPREIESAVHLANRERCQPPLSDNEVQKIVESILRYESGNTVPKGITADQLMAMDIREPKWIVNEILPEGLTMLAGKPKTGKSWSALQLGTAVALGKDYLGFRTSAGKVLLLALEDNNRRLKWRIKEQLQGSPIPSNLELHTEWPKGGVDVLEQWLVGNPDTKLVIIDTFARIRVDAGGRKSQYQLDSDSLEPLHRLAKQAEIAIVLVHHLRKTDSDDPVDLISGTLGIAGAVDGMWILQKGRRDTSAQLFITGRDCDQQDLSLVFENKVWRIAETSDDRSLTPERKAIIDSIRKAGRALTPLEIAKDIGKSADTIRQTVRKMDKAGHLCRLETGLYTIPNFVHSVHSPESSSSESKLPKRSASWPTF